MRRNTQAGIGGVALIGLILIRLGLVFFREPPRYDPPPEAYGGSWPQSPPTLPSRELLRPQSRKELLPPNFSMPKPAERPPSVLDGIIQRPLGASVLPDSTDRTAAEQANRDRQRREEEAAIAEHRFRREEFDGLIVRLRNRDAEVRRQAAVGLGRFGGAAMQALPALQLVAEVDPNPDVVAAAKAAIERIDADDPFAYEPPKAPAQPVASSDPARPSETPLQTLDAYIGAEQFRGVAFAGTRTVIVKSYTKSDGSVVREHYRSQAAKPRG